MILATGTRGTARSARTAMRIMRHAIEHLLEDWTDCGDDQYRGVLQAVKVLMDANNKIYRECPTNLNLFARFLKWINLEPDNPEFTVSVQKGEDRVQISCFSRDINLVAGINGTKIDFVKDIEALLTAYAASNKLLISATTYSRSDLDALQ